MASDEELFTTLSEIKVARGRVEHLRAALAQALEDEDTLTARALASGRIDKRGLALFCGERVVKPRGGARPRPAVVHTSGDSALMSASDIARLAGVTRAAVANWAVRQADFPVPADDAKPSRYKRCDVMVFLAAHGYRVQ
jgi:hypothetical protein